MSLDPTNYAALKTNIQGQGSLTGAVASSDWPTVANFYNAASATAVWIPNLPRSVVIANTNLVAFATKTTLLQATFTLMLLDGIVDATNANIRAGFSTVFQGADLTALSNIAQRLATRYEALFVSQAGPPIVSAVFGQTLTPDDVQKAMGK